MLLGAVIAILGTGPCVVAQSAGSDNPPRVELWGSVSAALSGPSGILTSSYAPPTLFFFSPPSINTAMQTLTFDSSTGVGFEVGANFFLSPHAGIQVFVDRASMDVSGPAAPYELTLQYRQPLEQGPNPPFKTVTLGKSVPLPNTTGSITQWVTAANAVARVAVTPRQCDVVWRPELLPDEWNVQPLGYTIFRTIEELRPFLPG
jgi:hypothetical protein